MNRILTIPAVSALLVALFSLTNSGSAQDKKPDAQLVAAVKAADDARVAAMREPKKDKLDAIFSDELRYAHSNASIDTKKSFVEVLTSGKTKYLEMTYESREFEFPAPTIALMSGRLHVKVESGANKLDSVLSYLAVWRLENGAWKFLAWQSCKVP